MSLRTRYVIAVLALTGFLGSVKADAQINATEHVQNGVYCGGVVTTQQPNLSTYVISGPESEVKNVFSQGNYVFINKGSAQGVKVGDEFLASRPETEEMMTIEGCFDFSRKGMAVLTACTVCIMSTSND